MAENKEGNAPPQEGEPKYRRNDLSENQFSELTKGAKELWRDGGRYSNISSFTHPKKEGWYIVAISPDQRLEDCSDGGNKYFETDDPRWANKK